MVCRGYRLEGAEHAGAPTLTASRVRCHEIVDVEKAAEQQIFLDAVTSDRHDDAIIARRQQTIALRLHSPAGGDESIRVAQGRAQNPHDRPTTANLFIALRMQQRGIMMGSMHGVLQKIVSSNSRVTSTPREASHAGLVFS
jgi:hypothetical protein